MFTRRKSIDENQMVLSGFVSKKDQIDKKRITGKTPRGQQGQAVRPSSSLTKKRIRPVSPPDSTIVQNKRGHMDNNTEVNKNNTTEEQSVTNAGHVPLNPELTELKRQIFAGFKTLLCTHQTGDKRIEIWSKNPV